MDPLVVGELGRATFKVGDECAVTLHVRRLSPCVVSRHRHPLDLDDECVWILDPAVSRHGVTLRILHDHPERELQLAAVFVAPAEQCGQLDDLRHVQWEASSSDSTYPSASTYSSKVGFHRMERC